MIHRMHLHKEPFLQIFEGKKTIELRLNDKKRQKIKVGDEIVFVSDFDTVLKADVVKLHKFSDFKSLYENLPLNKCGYDDTEVSSASPTDMEAYYDKEDINRYGVLGIEIKSVRKISQKEFVLASASPRRRELLSKEGYKFRVSPSTLPEDEDDNLSPQTYVERLALKKAKDVFSKEKTLCLAADTVVVLDGKILEKPADKPENAIFLKKLSGRSHFVYTGYAIVDFNKEISGFCKTEVVFNDLKDTLIDDYVEKGLGLDKAGGYGIQNDYPFVKEYIGSFTNVVGLPVETINELLKELIYES